MDQIGDKIWTYVTPHIQESLHCSNFLGCDDLKAHPWVLPAEEQEQGTTANKKFV
jgi:hypothetical protein